MNLSHFLCCMALNQQQISREAGWTPSRQNGKPNIPQNSAVSHLVHEGSVGKATMHAGSDPNLQTRAADLRLTNGRHWVHFPRLPKAGTSSDCETTRPK